MTIGKLSLVSIGKENIFLSSNPDITFFKIVYKRYTNFSIEPLPQYFKTTPDFGRRCTVNIGKNADLINKMYLYIELPPINNNNIKFKWVNKIGIALINFIDIEINGNIIDRHYGDWINIWNEITTSNGLKKSYNKMIGNISYLNNYSFSINNYILYIPLLFWFCLDTGLALPLISMSLSDIKVHVDFNDVNLCYNSSPSHYLNIIESYCIYETGEYFYQKYQNNEIIGEFIYFDPINKCIYYNPIKNIFIIPTNDNYNKLKLVGMKSNFECNIVINSTIIQNNDYFNFNKPSILNAYLLVDYIYLDNFERSQFINQNHEYIIQVIQTLPEQIINSINTIYKLPLFNPIKLLVWRTLLTSNINSNNFFTYTDNINSISNQLINKNLLIINSINRMDLSSIEYYTNIQSYQYNFINNQKGIFMYSFALNPLQLQPSGSMNFSKIDDAYLQLTMNNNINYQNSVSLKCYAIQYNLFRVSNGIAGLGFNI